MGAMRRWLVALPLLPLLVTPAVVSMTTHAAGAAKSAGGLSVFVAYAEDKEFKAPDPATFPVPWAGAPNTIFLGGTVPGQTACGTLTNCYDAGAIRLDNNGSTAVTVGGVSVDDHSLIPGGKVFNNLWGSFTVPPGKSVILTENPPGNNPPYDNFDTSSYPNGNCTPLAVAPTVTLTIAGVPTTLTDSTHVLDSGGIDTGSCPPAHNESLQWRPIGVAGSPAATLALGPAMQSAFAGQQVTETATLLDGSRTGLHNATVNFKVVSGPDAGLMGSSSTDGDGHATFTLAGASEGEDVVVASVTTVGSFASNLTHVMWVDGASAGWSAADIGNPTTEGSQSFDPSSGTWTVQGSGSDIGGTTDQFHFVWQTLPDGAGAAARVTSQTDTDPSAKAGVMVRATMDPSSPYYAAFVTPGDGIVIQDRATQGGTTTTVANPAGAAPAYLWVRGSGGTFTTFESNDGYTWDPVAGSAVTLNLGSPLLAGLAVTSHDGALSSSATMDSVVAGTSAPAPLPPIPCPTAWTCADIGSPAPAGAQSFDPNSGTWTIAGGGSDISGTADQFHYAWQSFSGDGTVSAQVVSQTTSSSQAKAGIMLRASADPSAANYAVLVTPGAGIKVQVRSAQGATTTKVANPAGTVPTYLEVTRSGNTFTAFTSPDGVSWTPIAGSTATVDLGTTILAGLAVTSHNTGTLSTVTMDAVSIG